MVDAMAPGEDMSIQLYSHLYVTIYIYIYTYDNVSCMYSYGLHVYLPVIAYVVTDNQDL
jgi:hypothetical protein